MKGGMLVSMNLQTEIEDRLWKVISNNYEKKNFSGAILDGIFFLGDLIRERTGLDGDGLPLVGQAFGGQNPKLKVNKLQTDNDKNIQYGMEQMLRGIYQAIRNPRSHEKFNDTDFDANSIIIFINYLLKIIDTAKSPFTLKEYVKLIYDPYFSKSDKYAELLVNKIPPNKFLPVFIEVYNNKKLELIDQIKYIFKELFKKLNEDEIKQALEIISEDLKTTIDLCLISTIIQILPPNYWDQIDHIARLRIENKLIESINEGLYFDDDNNNGYFGASAKYVAKYFTLKRELIGALVRKLSSSEYNEQEYVFHYFDGIFEDLIPEPYHYFILTIKKGLEAGDVRFYNLAGYYSYLDLWAKAFEKELAAFIETPSRSTIVPDYSDDEPPF
ncbi:MAG: TIGR02391 family protein [Thermacetogeniaceae bacterium]